MTTSNPVQDIHLTPVADTFVAMIEGINLSKPLDKIQYDYIHQALLDHQVLLFRDQQLSPDQHISFSKYFGELEKHVVSQFLLAEHPEIFVISNVKEDGKPIGAYGAGRQFHSDLAYVAEPCMGSIMYCLECPPTGGQTEFADMYAAYQAMPEDRRQWLRTQRGVHDYVYFYETFMTHRKPLTEQQKAEVPPVTHPAVRTHPETGRDVPFVYEIFTSHFEGMDVQESRQIIKEIADFVTQESFTYQHQWQPGDVVIWDNRCTMHRAMPFDEQNNRRIMHRTTIKGDRPFLRS